ncbi:MAG: hypothetical protein AABN34_15015, partial [Acidobacteriota bacterium]
FLFPFLFLFLPPFFFYFYFSFSKNLGGHTQHFPTCDPSLSKLKSQSLALPVPERGQATLPDLNPSLSKLKSRFFA